MLVVEHCDGVLKSMEFHSPLPPFFCFSSLFFPTVVPLANTNKQPNGFEIHCCRRVERVIRVLHLFICACVPNVPAICTAVICNTGTSEFTGSYTHKHLNVTCLYVVV